MDATHRSTSIDMVEDWPRELILSEIGDEIECPWVTGLHDDAEQSFEMLHALFNNINVSLRWTTLVARACKRASVNMKVIGP